MAATKKPAARVVPVDELLTADAPTPAKPRYTTAKIEVETAARAKTVASHQRKDLAVWLTEVVQAALVDAEAQMVRDLSAKKPASK